MLEIETKKCIWCEKELPLNKFGRLKKSKDNLRPTCKKCTNKRNKENRQRENSEWNPSNKEWLKNNLDRVGSCLNCAGIFEVGRNRRHIVKFCCDDCKYEYKYTNQNGLEKKLITLSSNLLIGKGKKVKIRKLVTDALGKNCVYCGTKLSLENITIDHKEAYASSERRRPKKENAEYRRKMDRLENLHVICRPCNQLKCDIDHGDYLRFLDFLETSEKMKASIVRRLKMANAPFGKRR